VALVLRQATLDDADACAGLHVDSVAGYAGVYDPAVLAGWSEGHSSDKWQVRLRGPGRFVLAIDDDGELLGCGGLVGNRTGLYVRLRAQRRGIARAIFHELETLARQRGHLALELSAPEPAVAFYESVGFERIGAAPHRFANGAELTTIDMRKVL
jgi:GNAT superfamily N-acetyltransferase